jgi:glycerophosphoryl diester phosphodiesterase
VRPYLEGPTPLLFAHRGGGKRWPENTLEAFRGSLALGFQYMETDLHLSADGELVLIHDETLERTTDGRGPVSAYAYDELRRLDAGYSFGPETGYPHRGRGLCIPTLGQLVDLDPEVRVNVEIKRCDPAVVGRLWRFIEERELHDRILVASSEHSHLERFRQLSRGTVATSCSAREAWAFWLGARVGMMRRLRIEYDALQLPPRHRGLAVVTKRFLDAAHSLNLHVHVWTLDESTEIRRLVDLGVDGVMSDLPALLIRTAR